MVTEEALGGTRIEDSEELIVTGDPPIANVSVDSIFIHTLKRADVYDVTRRWKSHVPATEWSSQIDLSSGDGVEVADPGVRCIHLNPRTISIVLVERIFLLYVNNLVRLGSYLQGLKVGYGNGGAHDRAD